MLSFLLFLAEKVPKPTASQLWDGKGLYFSYVKAIKHLNGLAKDLSRLLVLPWKREPEPLVLIESKLIIGLCYQEII